MQDRKIIQPVVGSYADFLDTGIWSGDETGRVAAPDDVTVAQIKDMLRMFGGVVYLSKDTNKLCWGIV